MPSSSAARMISSPLGTWISNPSMVTVTVSCVVCTVMCSLQTVDAAGSKGQPPSLWCWMNSSLKYWTAEVIGGVALSPSAQNARPVMLSQMSRSFSTSSSVPWPCSSRSRMRTSQNVPSRHGVHFPHDSCW